jgi:hypothetical protein
MGQRRNGGIEALQRVSRQIHRAGCEFRPWSCQRLFLGERRPGAVGVRTAPDAFGPQQPYGPAETPDVMEPDLPAPMAYGHNAAAWAAGDVLPGFGAQNQARRGCRDGADVDASKPSSVSARVHQRPSEQDTELVMSGSLLDIGCLVATNSKRP